MILPELLVMAAGMGSRFGGLKQLEPIGPNGEKIIDYSIYDARRAGIEKVVFVIRREFEKDFHQNVGAHFARWMDVGYAFQEMDLLPRGFTAPEGRMKPWGTAHAVLAAKDVIKGSFIVINADDFYGRNAFSKLAGWLSEPIQSGNEQYAMVAFRMTNTLSANGTVARGICQINESGLLEAVAEHTALQAFECGVRNTLPGGSETTFTGHELVSMNFWGFRPSLFTHLEELFSNFLDRHSKELYSEFYLPSAIDDLIRAGRATVKVLHTPDRWFGITYREDMDFVKARIRELTEGGEYTQPLWRC